MSKDRIGDAKKKLLEINKTVSGLDSTIRLAAFEILAPYYFEEEAEESREKSGSKRKLDNSGTQEGNKGREEFFTSFTHDQPNDNVLLIVAWLYSEHGLFPVTRKTIDEEATKNGLTVPNRSDASMRAAQEKGKKLFYKHGSGWQLTVHGEKYVKTKYSVKKGTKPLPNEEGE